MRLATWNIYWLGDEDGKHGVSRTQDDHRLIGEVIKNIAPDVMAFQEIVNVKVLQKILTATGGPGKRYVVQSDEGLWLSSDKNPDVSDGMQKVFLAINRKTVEFRRGAAIGGVPGVRRPYAATLRDRASGTEFVVVAVHLRSGYPSFLDENDAAVRRKEATALARWLQGKGQADTPAFPKPDTGLVAVLGDFNAELSDPNRSLRPLRVGSLSEWSWANPLPDAGQQTTAINDGYVIDYIMLSPEMAARVKTPPTIYAYDFDSRLGGPGRFHFSADGSGPLKDLRVSDHRPVLTVVSL